MLSALMIARLKFAARAHQAGRLVVVALLAGAVLATASCQKVPLLAPSGSTITLTAGTNVVAANGSVTLIAQVIEPAGTPPHPGTHVIFTTTLGVVEPAEATTDINGRALATFKAGGMNGTATITASSGGAVSATGTNALRISIGTAAVGRITLTANPNIIPATGGSSAVTASVVDLNGNSLPGVAVSFATSAGVLSNGLVNTDGSGVAQTTLTTSVEAVVTATVGVGGSGGGTTSPGNGDNNNNGGNNNSGSTAGQSTATVTVRVNPLPAISITATGTTFTAGSPIAFTVAVQPAQNSTAQIREVVVNFGDGTIRNLGAVSGDKLTVQHRYDDEGTYTVSVRATDTLGSVVTAATVIVVEAQPPLGVSITYTKATSGATTLVTFNATVLPSTTTVVQYLWNFGDQTPLQATASNQVVHSYTVPGSYPVSVTITASTGGSAVGQTVVVVP